MAAYTSIQKNKEFHKGSEALEFGLVVWCNKAKFYLLRERWDCRLHGVQCNWSENCKTAQTSLPITSWKEYKRLLRSTFIDCWTHLCSQYLGMFTIFLLTGSAWDNSFTKWLVWALSLRMVTNKFSQVLQSGTKNDSVDYIAIIFLYFFLKFF